MYAIQEGKVTPEQLGPERLGTVWKKFRTAAEAIVQRHISVEQTLEDARVLYIEQEKEF